MEIGIVGAGIAGLGAAIALHRAGHAVEVFEKSSFKREMGAAILLTPNGNRVLRRWGFAFEKARPVDFKSLRSVDADTLDVTARESLEGVEETFRERMCSYHRVDLHTGLRELAEKAGTGIRLGAEIVDVEPGAGIAHVKGGEKVKKDFWVLADGCHTHFLPKITEEDIPTVKIGKSVYRWLAPFEKVRQNPDAAALWTEKSPGFTTIFGKQFTMVTYPCRGGDLLNCAVFHNTRAGEGHKEDWNSDTSKESVLEALGDCHEAIRWLPETVAEGGLKVYTVTQRPPPMRIYQGRMLCVGDSAHHMLPTHAQGGCSALEDVGALEVFFNNSASSASPLFTNTPENLQERLHLYQQLRLPRSATAQILSSTNPFMTMEGLALKEAEIRKFYAGKLLDWPLGATQFDGAVRRFFYGYDVFVEAEKALEYLGRRLPDSWTWFGDVGNGG